MFDIESYLSTQSFIEADMIDAAINYWYNDREDFRSPFPKYVQDEVTEKAVKRFLGWSNRLKDDAKKEINDEILIEHFEEILFEEGTKLVKTDEEKLTLQYPYMLRCNDVVIHNNKPKSTVIKREIVKEGDNTFFRVFLKENDSKIEWETKFELPD